MKPYLLIVLLVLQTAFTSAQNTKEIWKLYNQKQYTEAIEQGIKALKHHANNGEINLAVGKSYVAARQFENALFHLKKSTHPAQVDWVRAWAYNYMGVYYWGLNDIANARLNFNACIALKATKNSVADAQQQLKQLEIKDYLAAWITLETDHLIFHFQDTMAIENLNSYMRCRESAYEKINCFFTASLPKKIDYYIWSKPEEAKKLLGKDLGWATSKTCTIHSSIHQTKGHEITHILSHYGIQSTHRSDFINEGIAVYFDQTTRHRMRAAKKHLNGQQTDILAHWENPKKENFQYNYSVGGAFVEWLFENGTPDQMKALLKDQSVKSAQKIYPDFHHLVMAFQIELIGRHKTASTRAQ